MLDICLNENIQEKFINKLRIPKSRAKLFQSAEKEFKLKILRTCFCTFKAFQQKVRSVGSYFKDKFTRKIFLHLKHKCLKAKTLQANYKEISQDKDFQKLTKFWNQWKTRYIKEKRSQLLFKKLLGKMELKSRVKAWSVWRTKFKFIDHDKKSLYAAIDHRNSCLKTKVFLKLANNIVNRRNQHTKRLRSYANHYNKQTSRVFTAWKAFIARRFHLRELFKKQFLK